MKTFEQKLSDHDKYDRITNKLGLITLVWIGTMVIILVIINLFY